VTSAACQACAETDQGSIAASRSVKPGLFEAFQNKVAGLLRAELCGEAPGIEKRREMGDNNALAFGVLVPAHLRIGGRKKRMRLGLDAASGAAGEGSITGLDRVAVAEEKILRDT